jgi:RNA polymerase sigma-70 factor (ECF subfamily)
MEQAAFDREYVQKLVVGDFEVQRHFVAYFAPLLHVKLRAKLRSRSLIEDVRQETYLRVLQSLRQRGIHNPERLGAFVNTVCNNVIYEMLRATYRHSPMPEDMPDLPDARDGPADQLVCDERKRIVERVLDTLSERDRQLLRKVYFEEQDKTKLCEEMQINGEYLRVLIHRARGRFKSVYEKGRERTNGHPYQKLARRVTRKASCDH